MILTLLFVCILLICFIIYLPILNGLASFKFEKKKVKHTQNEVKREPEEFRYIPPDEEEALRNKFKEDGKGIKIKISSLKEKMHFDSDDVPFKLHLNREGTLRKRHGAKLDIDTDPNHYDYDIDELIKKENEDAAIQQKEDFYRNSVIGKEKEEMV